MDDQPAAHADAPAPRGSPFALAVIASLVAHALFGAIVHVASADEDPPAAISMVDIEVAPLAPPAETLGAEVPAQPPEPNPDTIEQPPEPPPEPPPVQDDSFALDAGVPIDAAPKPEPEPVDAGPAVAELPDQPPGPEDGGLIATAPTDGGVPGDATGLDQKPASAATAANLLAHFPSKHMVSVVLRFDRLRDTEWSPILQEVLSAMPDFKTLIADPKTIVADKFDLVAMSSARWKDASATIFAVKSSMPPADLRDFLDEPGAPVAWSRVTGGVLGTRAPGDRVRKGDTRVFLSPFSEWTILAKPKDLKGALDPVDGDLDAITVEIGKLPAWIQHVPDLEAESGIPDGPAVLVTLAPKSKRWELPPFGISIEDLPAPERLTLTAELDPHGFLIKGNLKFRSVEDAAEFVKSLEAAQKEALADSLISSLLGKIRAKNLVDGLTLDRTDDRVSYSTSISIADARKLFALGATMVVEYFEDLTAPDPEPEPQP